jgi:hypothetical protein
MSLAFGSFWESSVWKRTDRLSCSASLDDTPGDPEGRRRQPGNVTNTPLGKVPGRRTFPSSLIART